MLFAKNVSTSADCNVLYIALLSFFVSDIKAKAKRWDEKHLDVLKKKRDSYMNELKTFAQDRRKETELQTLRSQIDGLENRLRYARRDKDTTVS